MTFSDLRALHALIGTAIDDMERIYRPQQRAGSRRASQSSARPTPISSPAPANTARSSTSTNTTDSDTDDFCEADISKPPTPISPGFTASPSNNSVRFANGGKARKVRERAHTVSGPPHPPLGCSPSPLPPPILKQPPLEWPSLDAPITASSMTAPEPVDEATPVINHIPSPVEPVIPFTPSVPPSVSLRVAESTHPPSPYTPHTPGGHNDDVGSVGLNRKATEVEAGGETPRQREWKKKCEDLTSHPEVINAVNRIVAACGQLAAMVQKPFLVLCDAAMAYHLPACLRFMEASHIVEILREAGTRGMHVDEIATCISSGNVYGGEGVLDSNKLSHILRLLATHHIGREVRPDVFANNRLSSIIDSGKPWRDLMMATSGGKNAPEKKYENTDGTAAFIGLCTDELFKAAAYLTDCYLYPSSCQPTSPTRPSFPTEAPGAIPPVPPLPPQISHTVSAPSSGIKSLGTGISDEPTTAHLSPMARLRKKKSEIGLSLDIAKIAKSNANGPMTFAQNSLQGSPTSVSSLMDSHIRKHNRTASYTSSLGSITGTPPPPPPPTPARPGILKRLSHRSVSPTPDVLQPPMPPFSSLALPQTPNSPRSPIFRSMSSQSLSSGYNEHNLSTPKSTPVKDRSRMMDVGRTDLQSTPKSNPSSARAKEKDHLMTTPKSTPNHESLSSITNLTMHASGDGRRRTSPPTPKSPLASRKQTGLLSSRGENVNGYSSSPGYVKRQTQDGQGLLGPAFDLQPPALVSSPRSRTFSESVPSSPATASFDHHRSYASPIPPPVPPKSSLRGLHSSASASSISLVSVSDKHTRQPSGKNVTEGSEMYAPFNVAFNTKMRYFEWLEKSENSFRFKRFGKAMTGTGGWEVPGSVITGFHWHELPTRSVVVDVGGGIGSTSMLLANAFPHLRFIIQDRPPVVEMGVMAWRARYPEVLDSGRVAFQPHDFFKTQLPFPAELNCSRLSHESESANETEGCDPTLSNRLFKAPAPAVFLMRVITHDWPDSYVTRILLQLRRAAGPDTKLVIADFVLPLACADEVEDVVSASVDDLDGAMNGLKGSKQPLPGTVRTLAPEGSSLLANLGKANAHAYWLDLTMRAMFNSQERTLRELSAVTLSAGWKITQVTRADGSVFGHMVAVPVDIPEETLRSPIMEEEEDECPSSMSATSDSHLPTNVRSPPMGDTFLTRVDLPSEAAIRQSVLSGILRMNSRKSPEGEKKKRGRERSSTFTGQRNVAGKDGKTAGGGEVRKGFRTLMKMLSKTQLRTAEGSPSGGRSQS
ncbi:hypothetical protein BDW22DRAFT_1431862 [Trametopsis cervina]|nr:hypothetical protein BDW22DRAFT_1431862 [Trametopsis cervina]